MTRIRPTRSEFAHFETYPTRWRDNDAYGHLNNAVFYEYVDTLVNGWLIRRGAVEIPGGPVICLEDYASFTSMIRATETIRPSRRTFR